MCTAVSYKTKDHYFGRTLDLEYSYHETVTVTPRNFPFAFRKMGEMKTHYAMIGMAYVAEDYPLYYEAVNECGLGMAGLNFPGNACYYEETEGKDNVSPFEFIPWILSQCSSVAEAKEKLSRINLVRINFSESLPLSTLHWIIADRECSVVVEAMKDGMKIYDDPAHSIVVVDAEGSVKYYDVEQIQTNDNQTASGTIDEFVGALKEKRESIFDACDVIKSMKVVFASIKSAEEGKTVQV